MSVAGRDVQGRLFHGVAVGGSGVTFEDQPLDFVELVLLDTKEELVPVFPVRARSMAVLKVIIENTQVMTTSATIDVTSERGRGGANKGRCCHGE